MNPTTNPTAAELPAEPTHGYKAGAYLTIYLNQADRDGEVLAVEGERVLFKYTMERSGRVFGGVLDYSRAAQYSDLPAHYTSATLASLPAKWQRAIAAQGGQLSAAEIVASKRGRVDAQDLAYWLGRVPAWVLALPCNRAAEGAR